MTDIGTRVAVAAQYARNLERTLLITHNLGLLGVSIQVHVGKDAWDYLREHLRHVDKAAPLTGDVGAFFGFPVFLERAWGDDRIEVRLHQVIF